MSYQNYYKKNFKERISFIKKFSYFYKTLGDEINKNFEVNPNLLFFSAGHSYLTNYLKYKKLYLSEIIDDFALEYVSQKKNGSVSILKKDKINRIPQLKINDVLITSLEYSSDPIELLKKINNLIESDCKINIITNNVFWNPLFNLLESLGLKFKHPRRNLITSNFIHNLCFLSDFELLKQKKIILFPLQIPFISYLLNNFFTKIPIIKLFCLTNIFVLKPIKRNKKKLKDLKISIIVPCKNEEKNITNVFNSMMKYGKETEVLFGDDKSSDNTKDEIYKIMKIQKNFNTRYYEGPGISKAQNIYKGFGLAKGDILVIHDADNTVQPKELIKFFEALIEKDQNLVIGTRFVYPMESGAMKKSNFFGNILFSYFYSIIIQRKITDTLCGTKVFYKSDWEKIKKYCGTWGIEDKWGDFDILSGARKNYMKISEIPVNYKERIEEESKMTNTIFNGIRMLVICINSFFKLRF
ncbi:glycosyltransferase family 2 protein [Rickettsiales bacterium]|nr:glycosyltransferase family 2 protein [Rickettsiales bacterium]